MADDQLAAPGQSAGGRSGVMCPTTALELFKAFKTAEQTWARLHRTDLHVYLGVVSALLGATLIALPHVLEKSPCVTLVFVTGPVVSYLLSRFGRKMCDRSYKSAMEAITCQAKLEPLFGLAQPRPTPCVPPIQVAFPADKSFLPPRWLAGRRPFDTADDFLCARLPGGANGLVHRTFDVLAAASVFLGIVIIVRAVLALLGCV